MLAAHARTHETHEPLSVEYRLLTKDGRVVWIRDEGVVVDDDDGEPLYLQGYLLDITSEREAQIELRQMALYDPLRALPTARSSTSSFGMRCRCGTSEGSTRRSSSST